MQPQLDSPSAVEIRYRTLADFDDVPDPRFVAPGLVVSGATTLLYSDPGAGKSWLIWALINGWSGATFLGHDLPRSSVVYYTEENDSAIADKIRRFGVPRDAPHMIADRAKGPPSDPSSMCQEIYTAVLSNGFDVAIVDTLGAWTTFDDYNAYGMAGEMQPFRQLTSLLPDVALIVVHHAAKAATDATRAALGSQGLAGATDVRVHLTRDGAQRYLNIPSSRYNPYPFQEGERQAYVIEDGVAKLTDSPADKRRDAMMDLIGNEWLSVAALAEQYNDGLPDAERISRDTVARTLAALHAMGQLERSVGPRNAAIYRLPED